MPERPVLTRLTAVCAAIALLLATACGSVRDAADDDATLTPEPSASAVTRTPDDAATPAPTDEPQSPSPASTPAVVTPTAIAATATPALCRGRCPTDLTTPTPPVVGGDGVPRVPPLRALTFSPGEALTEADLYTRGFGTPGRGPFAGVALVIPSIGIDAPIETQVVGPNGDMPEPTSMRIIAWYDFAQWPGLGGVPLGGGNVVMAANLGGVFAQLAAVQRDEILVLHLNDGRRLFYRVEFNKTTAAEGADWAGIAAATADESMTLITAAGTGSGNNWTHRRIVWARRVNCELREAPETPTRAPHVECELPQ